MIQIDIVIWPKIWKYGYTTLLFLSELLFHSFPTQGYFLTSARRSEKKVLLQVACDINNKKYSFIIFKKRVKSNDSQPWSLVMGAKNLGEESRIHLQSKRKEWK